jgi:cysteinyl-tRNA synthetase
MNITDVDDKTIRATLKEFGQEADINHLRKHTEKFLDLYLSDLKVLNIDSSTIEIFRVADVIPEIQNFIVKLLEKGFAYNTDDGTYFSIEKYQQAFGDYGQLVGSKFIEGKKIGARVKVDEYEKDNLSDFVLWKKQDAEDGGIFWDHAMLGKGRPGWLIECSVINEVGFQGQPTDIHTGGVDLIFPHHTNEIAQSQPIHKPFVKFWAHSEHLQVDNKKMAKRDGNVFYLKDVVDKGFNPLALRYLYFQTDFRKSMNFTWESLEASQVALKRLYAQIDSLMMEAKDNEPQSSAQKSNLKKQFQDALENNLNTPQALALVWEVLGDDKLSGSEKIDLLVKFDSVLGLSLLADRVQAIPPQVTELLASRQKARDEKDFSASDELRQQILQLGFEVLDTPEGQKARPL